MATGFSLQLKWSLSKIQPIITACNYSAVVSTHHRSSVVKHGAQIVMASAEVIRNARAVDIQRAAKLQRREIRLILWH